MFNVRVYGILINPNDELLVADEYIRGNFYTKFPGGGLEFGEGTRDCLVREFMEELNLKIKVGEHLYTTDFFQMSAFTPNQQILSIYYYVHALEPLNVQFTSRPFDFTERQLDIYKKTGETESFRMIPMSLLKEEDVTLPIDKVVVDILRNR